MRAGTRATPHRIASLLAPPPNPATLPRPYKTPAATCHPQLPSLTRQSTDTVYPCLARHRGCGRPRAAAPAVPKNRQSLDHLPAAHCPRATIQSPSRYIPRRPLPESLASPGLVVAVAVELVVVACCVLLARRQDAAGASAVRVRAVIRRRGLRRPVRRGVGLLDAVPRRGGGAALLQGGRRRRRSIAVLRRRRARSGLHALARHAVHAPGRGRRPRTCRRCRPLQGARPRFAGTPVRQLRHHVHAALAERAAGTQVAVQRVRDPVQEGRAAGRSGRRRAGAAGQRGHVVRVRRLREAGAAAAAAVGVLRPGRGSQVGGVLRNVRRRRRRCRFGGGRALPVVDAQRDAGLVGVRRPGEAHPVPVLLALG